jgi:2-amino-4-hydroxy-6-hydroxymethyldihydropteridine diphosphokinase
VTDDIGRTVASPAPPARRRPRVRAFVGLGSNVGDRDATLAGAVAALRALPGARLDRVSSLYETRAVGIVDQPDFRNAVVAVSVPPGPHPVTGALALLVALKRLERAFGRVDRGRWGPRELDLDLLLFGRARLDVDRPPNDLRLDVAADLGRRPDGRLLIVPHPEMAERLFVLAPLTELAPSLVPPGWSESVGAAKERRLAIEGPAAVRPVGAWNDRHGVWVATGTERPAPV